MFGNKKPRLLASQKPISDQFLKEKEKWKSGPRNEQIPKIKVIITWIHWECYDNQRTFFWQNMSLELTFALTLLLLTMWRSEDETHSVEENARHYLNHVSSERTSFNLVKSHIRPSRFSCDWKFVLWIISTPGLFQWFPAQHLAQSHPNMARGIMAEGRHHSESCHHSVYSQHQTSTSITLYKAWPQNITLYKADMWPSVAWSPACNEHHHLDLNSDLAAAAARHRTFTIISNVMSFDHPRPCSLSCCFFLQKNCNEKTMIWIRIWQWQSITRWKQHHHHNQSNVRRTWPVDHPHSCFWTFFCFCWSVWWSARILVC